jgi:PAS domain S-box-containing protein
MTYADAMQEPGQRAGWERLFWLVFERTSNPIALLDDQRRIVEVNDAGLSLLGRHRGDVVGLSIVESIRPDERTAAAREWQAFLRDGEYSGRRALIRADGSEVQVEFAARLEVLGGRRLAIYVAMVDGDPPLSPSSQPAGELPLTKREREVVTLIALGQDTTEIARELHISPETVRTHVRNAMSKLGARTRAHLVAIVLCSEHAVHVPCIEGHLRAT